jgi:hypothetical protein
MRNLEKNIFGVIQWIFGARTVDPRFFTVHRKGRPGFETSRSRHGHGHGTFRLKTKDSLH